MIPPCSRAAETKGLVMVPLSHTRLCVLVELGNETAVKQSCTLFCVRKDAQALLLLRCSPHNRVMTQKSCGQHRNHSRASFKVRAHVDSRGVVFESAQVNEHNQEESAEHVVGTHGCKSHYVRTLLTLMSPQSCPLKH